MMHPDERCETCAAWVNDTDQVAAGDCRRRIGLRGPVDAAYWCFEYVPKVPVKCGECWAWDSTSGKCRADGHNMMFDYEWCLKGRKNPIFGARELCCGWCNRMVVPVDYDEADMEWRCPKCHEINTMEASSLKGRKKPLDPESEKK